MVYSGGWYGGCGPGPLGGCGAGALGWLGCMLMLIVASFVLELTVAFSLPCIDVGIYLQLRL